MGKYTLYLKESPLGLKYLGFTIKDPYTYKGSGYKWVEHLKKYGYTSKDLLTTILFSSDSFEELKEKAAYYSKYYNIVNSIRFANQVVENCGAPIGYKHTEENKKLFSAQRKGRTTWNKGIPHTLETKEKMRNSNLGRIYTKERNLKISKALKGVMPSEQCRKAAIKSCSKAILECNDLGEVINEWPSVSAIALHLGVDRSTIRNICKGTSKITQYNLKYK